MIVAVDMCVQRLTRRGGEEGFRPQPYWDKTGEVIAPGPKGNPTWLYGCNLATEGTPALGYAIAATKAGQLYDQLLPRPWFAAANDARKSVFLDIAFNQGMHGLLDYPHMIAYAAEGNWTGASAQCTVAPSEPAGVQARYRVLAEILQTGTNNAYVP